MDRERENNAKGNRYLAHKVLCYIREIRRVRRRTVLNNIVNMQSTD